MTKKSTFNSTALFAAATPILKPVRLHLAELGGDVCIKRHTLAEREAFNAAITDCDKADQNAVGVQLATCDDDGNLIFSANDIEAIKGLPATVTTDILYKYNVINGLIAPIDDIDDAKKNS